MFHEQKSSICSDTDVWIATLVRQHGDGLQYNNFTAMVNPFFGYHGMLVTL